MRIVLTGGGTAGHVMPFESIVEALRTRFIDKREGLPSNIDTKVLTLQFVGVADENTKKLFKKYDVAVVHVPSGKLRRYISPRTIVDLLFRLPWGVLRALIGLYMIMPDVVISKGGYGSLPVIVAAAWYRIPILLHESDVAPGLSNSIAIKRALAITAGFPGMKEHVQKWAYKIFVTGTPVRPGLRDIEQTVAKREFGIAEGEKVLLVMGGSQGAKQINEVLLKVLAEIIPDFTVIHVTGVDNFDAVSTVGKELVAQSPRKDNYMPFAYLDDKMNTALAAADGIVSRAGASSLSEIAALRKPAVIIPLANAANDHQRKNAQVFDAAGAILVLDPTNVGENIFKQNIVRIMSDTETRNVLSRNLEHMDFPNAARDIAEVAYKLAKGFAPQRKKTSQ